MKTVQVQTQQRFHCLTLSLTTVSSTVAKLSSGGLNEQNMKIVKHSYISANFLLGNALFQLSSVLTIDLLKLRSTCKHYYSLFLDKLKSQDTSPMIWDHEFAQTALPWNQIFHRVKVICKESQLREFYFKLIHFIVAKKKELTLYGNTDNNKAQCFQ